MIARNLVAVAVLAAVVLGVWLHVERQARISACYGHGYYGTMVVCLDREGVVVDDGDRDLLQGR